MDRQSDEQRRFEPRNGFFTLLSIPFFRKRQLNDAFGSGGQLPRETKLPAFAPLQPPVSLGTARLGFWASPLDHNRNKSVSSSTLLADASEGQDVAGAEGTSIGGDIDGLKQGVDDELSSKELKKQLEDFQECESKKRTSLWSSHKVQFMFKSLARAGCSVNPWDFIRCVPCNNLIAGAANVKRDGTMEVLMCQNVKKSQNDFSTVVSHELLHVYDACRAHADFSNCDHHACSEIRAANLSGDCTWSRELFRLEPGWLNHHNKCVRRRAITSVSMNPYCEGQAEKAVDRVFDKCVRDLAPFNTIPVR